MRARALADLLKAGDRVAVSNVTGREASGVTAASQKYCGNIVGGWALGKGGQSIPLPGTPSGPDRPGGQAIPVFSTAQELMGSLPRDKRPNKVVVYSPPPAVYGEVKEIVASSQEYAEGEYGRGPVETIFVITEHVSVEVTAKVARLSVDANIDVLGCNTLGVINTHDRVRVGAVGGERPDESFQPGGAAIISNSGNMVTTMASYLGSAGLGTSYGVSTGKDVLILLPLRNLLELARNDERTKLVVLYLEPGGLYEKEAVEMLRETEYPKPIIAYVTGEILSKRDLSLGHSGAVVEGGETTAAAKMRMFDEYSGVGPFVPDAGRMESAKLAEALRRGIRITALHHLPAAAALVCDTLGIHRDFRPKRPLALNPWFLSFGKLGKKLPRSSLLHQGTVPEPYASQVAALAVETLGARLSGRNMRNASHASSNDGVVTRIYGSSVEKEMRTGSFARSLILAWTGEEPRRESEPALLERCLIASITNGPGTISAQAAKLSASAGNSPNTAMIATLACIGDVHGGNGRRGVEYLSRIFADVGLEDPYDPAHGIDLEAVVAEEVDRFSRLRSAAKEAGTDYERIPCLGHPVFRGQPLNYDPRERVIAEHLEENGLYNVFLEFYHMLACRLKEVGIARNVWAVNLDGAIASVALGICWKPLLEKRMTLRRACDIAFVVFALGRAAGGAAEFLDHQDFGAPMDMRIPVNECTALTRLRRSDTTATADERG